MALQCDPTDASIRNAYASLRRALQEQNKKDKTSFHGFLNKVRYDDSTEEIDQSKPVSASSGSGITLRDLKTIINNLEQRISKDNTDEEDKSRLQQQLDDLHREYTAAVLSSRQRIIDAILQIDMQTPSEEVMRDAAENGLDLCDEKYDVR